MSWEHFDKIAAKLARVCDKDLTNHGARNDGSVITEDIEYFDLRELIEGYEQLRAMHRAMRKFIPAIIDFAETEMRNDGKFH